MKKYIFFISLCLLLLSCATLSRDYEKSNIIIAPENQDTSNLEYITLLTLQTRTHLSYDELIIKSVNEIAEKGYHDVIIIPKLINYNEIGASNSYNYNRQGRASPMDAFNSFANAFSGILDSVNRYYYIVHFYIYKPRPRQDKSIPLNRKSKNLDQEPSFLEIQKKAKNGDAEAQFYLSNMYYAGKGVAIDKERAFYWCKQSAEQGYTKAQYVLGVMFYEGEGTLIDKKEAAYWINQAYKKGFQPAKEFWDTYELWKYKD